MPDVNERAERIHQEATIILAHDHLPPADDVEAMRAGGVTAKILLANVDVRVWTDDPEDYKRSITEIDGWYEWACGIYRQMQEQIDGDPRMITIRSTDDIVRAKRDGLTGTILGSEGGKLVEYSLANLRSLYDLGLRHILLTWAYSNQLSGSEMDPENRGLSEFGREVVCEMNRLGIVVDITHISRQAMQDVYATSTKPVLNSHTTWKAISNRIPALTEPEIRDLADHGGVLALHFMTHMLTGRFEPRATMAEVIRQINEIVRIGGIECLALGPDYIPESANFKQNSGQPNLTFPIGLESPACMLNLTKALVAEGYSDEAIGKILGGNLMRLFRETIG
jgi:membrane dipeptidase